LRHPLEDIFAVIVQPYSEDCAALTTKILHFRPSSKEAIAIRTLPFRFRVVAWNMLAEECRTLVGITYTWNVVECGIKDNHDSESVAKGISFDADVPSKRTLFQDMFGKSAFDELKKPLTVVSPTDNTSNRLDSGSLLSHFDSPAYLGQPIENMYISLIDRLLLKAPEQRDSLAEEGQDEAEDMAMDEPVVDVPVIGRTVEDEEVELLASLFRGQTIKGMSRVFQL
jgi:NET1-associated nuclear protein 1 (U3 small nucleolar RNA-associated protein 17)